MNRARVVVVAAVAAVVITGCGPSERERDCAEIDQLTKLCKLPSTK